MMAKLLIFCILLVSGLALSQVTTSNIFLTIPFQFFNIIFPKKKALSTYEFDARNLEALKEKLGVKSNEELNNLLLDMMTEENDDDNDAVNE